MPLAILLIIFNFLGLRFAPPLLIRLELRLRSASAASRERLRRGFARFAPQFN
jgi:hypothetical protein